MAKLKSYAVEIEYTVRETIYVEARRPAGAEEKALGAEAYREAHQWNGCEECGGQAAVSLPKDAKVVSVRQV